MSELNTQVLMTVQAGPVANTPIDDTLAIEGAAADSKAVGDALALKADKSELARAITVNGQSADNDGAIIIDGTDVQVSGEDTRTISAAIAAEGAKTAATIPMSSDPGADTIAEAMADFLTVNEQTFTEDEKLQVRENIGAAPSNIADNRLMFVQLASVSSNSNKTYVLENDTKAIFVAFGSTAATKGFWIVNLATASVTIKDLGEASSLTMTAPSTGKVNIANSANVGTRVYAIVFAGSVADQST